MKTIVLGAAGRVYSRIEKHLTRTLHQGGLSCGSRLDRVQPQALILFSEWSETKNVVPMDPVHLPR